jgi:cytochrome P450
MANQTAIESSPGVGRAVRQFADLPGPRGLPIVGNMLQMHPGRAHQVVEAWARRYGPYFKFRLGGRHFLGVTDHENVITVLRARPDGFRRTERLEQVVREMGVEPGVFVANGDAWQRQRRLVMSAFDPTHVRSYFPTLLTVTRRLHRRWQAAAASDDSIDLRADLMRYTVDGVAGLAFGSEINTLEGGSEVIQNHLDRILPAIFRRVLTPLPYWRYFTSPEDRGLAESVAAINTAVQGFITDARDRMKANPELIDRPSNLLEAMIAAAQRESGAVSDAEIAGNVFTMLLAGEDTTANTLAWLIWLLFKNPPALEQCRDEVRRTIAELSSMTPESIASLDYLEACANEAMRLKPVAPTILNEALRDTTIGDVRIKAGTIVWLVLRHDTLDEHFFPNPNAFEPRRWLATCVHGSDSAKRIAMPFGGGPRICPGRYLALLEIKMAMAMLLGQFDVKSVATSDERDPAEYLALTMAPVGLRMRVRERQPGRRSN